MAFSKILDERFAPVWLGLAMLASAGATLWFSRGTIFWIDELTWLIESPQLDLRGALEPHEGHLVLATRLVYRLFLELFGSTYLPFRLLCVATVLLTVALLFAFMRRRTSALAALAPCLVLLFFGSDMLHAIVGNAFTVLFSVACGTAALLVLERDDRRGDLLACLFLILGLATYTVAVAFVAGVAVYLLQRDDRRRRAWVVVIPVALYGAWAIWARSVAGGPDNQVAVADLLLFGAWGFQSLSAVLGALTGLDYDFSGSSGQAQAGPVLAVLALIGVGLRLRAGPPPPMLWATLAVVATLWCLGVLASGDGARPPESSRYMFPAAVAVLLVASECVAGARWSRQGLLALYAVALAGLAVNLSLLRDEGAALRYRYAVQVKAAFAGLDLVGPDARANFEPPAVPGGEGYLGEGESPLRFPFGVVSEEGASPVDAYLEAAQSYGSLGYDAAQLRERGEPVGAQVDGTVVAALGIAPRPGSALPGQDGCRDLRGGEGRVIATQLPRGGGLLEAGGPGQLALRRFATSTWTPVGPLRPGEPAILRIPPDAAGDPWRLSSTSSSLRVCPLR